MLEKIDTEGVNSKDDGGRYVGGRESKERDRGGEGKAEMCGKWEGGGREGGEREGREREGRVEEERDKEFCK